MILGELKERIDFYLRNHPERIDHEVVIKLNESNFGPIASTQVESISPGIDWDKDTFIIFTKDEIVKKK